MVLGLFAGIGGALVVNAIDQPDEGTNASLNVSRDSVVQVVKDVLPSVVSITLTDSTGTVTGSGFVWDRRGDIVTNNHVVREAVSGTPIEVSIAGGQPRQATLVGRSPSYDLAVVKVDASASLKPVRLADSTTVQVGEQVLAIGSPLGLSQTVTSGIISAAKRPVTVGGASETAFINALQTDAAINPGNSGGPLVDLSGRVVGVNSAIATVGQASSTDQSGNIGVGFAIPMQQVRTTVAQLIDKGQAEYPIIGAQVNTATTTDGAQIESIDTGSPAASAGLQAGDVIHGVDGQPISDGVELIVTIRSYQPGDRIAVTYARGRATAKVEITLAGKVG